MFNNRVKKRYVALLCIMIWGSVLSALFAQSDTVFIRYNLSDYEEPLDYHTDTVIFASPMTRTMLHGTSVLPATVNQQYARAFGLLLENVTISECQNHSNDYWKEEVVAVVKSEGRLTIETKIWRNCCHSFLCDVEVINDEVINLIIHGYGATYCACNCCFGLTFDFEIEETEMQNANYKKLKAVMIDGNKKTKKLF